MQRSVSYILLLVIVLCLGSCSTKKRIAIPYPSEWSDNPRHDKGNKGGANLPGDISNARRAMIEASYGWLGTPYKYGADEKGSGCDCSGLVLRLYEDVANVKLPRNSAGQAEYCKEISEREIVPGDLVFFATGKDPDRISHVGMMIDREQFIHASSSKGVVISNIRTPYYVRTFKCFGRAIPK